METATSRVLKSWLTMPEAERAAMRKRSPDLCKKLDHAMKVRQEIIARHKATQ